jgi:plasmid maintenance system antidote protein VapI
MNYEELFEKLKKQYTVEEIAEAYMIPAKLTDEEKAEANEEMKRLRFQLLKEKTEKDQLYAELMKLRINMKDYLQQGVYDAQYSFGSFLKKYITLLGKPHTEFAEDIGLHHTKLSRIVNQKEEPNIALTYRLEKHSDQLIPAIFWWKLWAKKQENLLRKDEKNRNAEAAKVKNPLDFAA